MVGMQKNIDTIRVGDTKALYLLNRIAPKKAYDIINAKKEFTKLK